jgi:hypothetical protein
MREIFGKIKFGEKMETKRKNGGETKYQINGYIT